MKRTVIVFVFAGLVSCGGGNAGSVAGDMAAAAAVPAVTESSVPADEFTDDGSAADANSGATVVPGEMTFNGTMVMPPQSHATVSLSMDGIVRSASLLPGSYVRKGTLLATVENPEFIELQETYLDAAAQLEYLESEYNRQKALAKEEAASLKKLEQSKADYLSMKSRLDGASARLAIQGIDAGSLKANGINPLIEVKAPISGYLSDVRMNIGKHISAGEPLCEIIDKSNMLVKLTAYEKDLKNIGVGHRIEFGVNGIEERTFTGKIISVGHHVDGANRSIEVYASIDDKHNMFRPGMYVNAHIMDK